MAVRYSTRVLMAMVLLLSALARAEVRQDPQGRFSVDAPIGWKMTIHDDKMKLTMGDSYIEIFHVDGQKSAVKVLQSALGEVEGFPGGRQLGNGETTLGGEHAVFANFASVDDRSVTMYLRFVATDSGWVFSFVTPQTGFTTLHPSLTTIENSFQLTKTASPATPKN